MRSLRHPAITLLMGAALLAASAGAEERLSEPYHYHCINGITFSARLSTTHVTLQLPRKQLTLPRVASASGMQYADAQTTFWYEGKEATLLQRGERNTFCQTEQAVQLPAHAEPKAPQKAVAKTRPAEPVTAKKAYAEKPAEAVSDPVAAQSPAKPPVTESEKTGKPGTPEKRRIVSTPQKAADATPTQTVTFLPATPPAPEVKTPLKRQSAHTLPEKKRPAAAAPHIREQAPIRKPSRQEKIYRTDFRGSGHNPEWEVVIVGNTVMLISELTASDLIFQQAAVFEDKRNRKTTYRGQKSGHSLEMELIAQPCRPTADGKTYNTTVFILLDGTQSWQGCGTSYR